MDREIKFRAIDNNNEWCYGLPTYDLDGDLDMSHHTGFTSYGDIEKTLSQFTGLKDKNGVEIYEGDIVKWGHIEGFIELSGVRIAVVDMSNSCDGLTFDAFKPVSHRFKIGNFMYRHSTDKCMEVIGNIHQNPELLEQ